MKRIFILIFSICSVATFGQTVLNPGGSNSTANINNGISLSAVASGTNTYTVTIIGATYTNNKAYTITFTNANTTSSTININDGTNNLGAITIKKYSSGSLVNLSSGDISAGESKRIRYNGTNFFIEGGSNGGSFWPLSGSALGTGDVNVSGLSNTASVLWQNLNLFGTDTAKVYSFGTVKLKAPIVQLSTVPTNNDTISHILVRDNSTGQIKTRRASSVTGSGTVTSVALSLPSIFSVSGSPVTTSGTLTGTLATQSANTFFAGPTSGGVATPTFRTMVAADVPTLPYWPVTGTKSLTGAVTINSITDTRTLTFTGVSGSDDNTKIMGATFDNWTINSATSTSNLNRSATNFSADVNSSSGNYVNSITVDNNGAQLQSLTVTPGTGSTILVNNSTGIDLNNAVTGKRLQLDGTGVKLTLGSDATGDIFYRNSSGYVTRLGVGSNGQFLKLASGLPSYASITASDVTSGAALTKTDDTNVTLTLGGSPTTSLLAATSLTLGWTGQLSLSRGGTNANLTASNGGIFYSTGTAGAILSGTATANKMLLSGSSSAPTWSTSTIPTSAGATANKVLLSDGTNYVLSTPTFPNASATARKKIVSDGTNWVASTETWAVPGTSGNVLVSDGTNWTSSSVTGAFWSTATGGTLTSANTITINTPSWLTYTGTWTATANSQSQINIGGSYTSRNTASDFLHAVELSPTLTVNGGAPISQTLVGLRVNPTFSGTATTYAATFGGDIALNDHGTAADRSIWINNMRLRSSSNNNLTWINNTTGFTLFSFSSGGIDFNSPGTTQFRSQATTSNVFFIGDQTTSPTTARVAKITGQVPHGSTAYAPTSGSSGLLELGGSNGLGNFQPSSGTATHTTLALKDVINQTGTASGNFIDLDIDPTLTSLMGTHIAIRNKSGRVLINGTTITSSTELDIRGTGTTSSTINTRFANSSNTLLSQLTDDGTWTHSGNFTLGTAGNKFSIKEGTGGFMGQTTLVAGTKAVTVTGVTTSTRCFLQLVTPNTVAATVTYQCACTANTVTLQANIAAGTINTADVSTLNYILYEPAP